MGRDEDISHVEAMDATCLLSAHCPIPVLGPAMPSAEDPWFAKLGLNLHSDGVGWLGTKGVLGTDYGHE
jgi:hypothetical protein